MKVQKEMNVYCPYCNKHTKHSAKLYSSKPERWMNVGRRRHERAIRGYVGKVEPVAHSKKPGKRQKLMLECSVCKKTVERVIHGRTKKKLEIAR